MDREVFRRHRRLTLAAGCLISAAALAACSSTASSTGGGTSGAGSSGSASASSAPKAGGQVTVEEAGLNSTFDPALNFVSTFTDGPEMMALYGPGLAYQNATTGAVEMGFAKSITADDSTNKAWTLVLHDGLKFSDGTAFDAASVVANIKRIADPATGSTQQKLAAAIEATATDATTVKFTLQTANSQFPSEISQYFALVPSPTAITKEGSSFGSNPVGPGPFMMGKLTPSVSLSLVKNPNFSLYAPNQPYLDGITFEQVSDQTQVQANLTSGQAQAAALSTGQTIATATGNGMTAIVNHPVGGAWLDINHSVAPFNDIRARQAVYLALDRKALANVWAPGNPVSTNYFPSSSPYYNPELDWPAQDKVKAQELFNQLAAEGKPVKFTILWPTGTNSTTAQYVASVLNTFKNVSVTTKIVLPAQYTTDLNQTQNYQMTAYGFYNSALFPTTAAIFGTGGALNYEKIADPKLDDAISQMLSSTDDAGFKTGVNAFVKELRDQYDFIPAQQGTIGFIYNAKAIGGVHPVEFGMTALWGEMYSLNA